MLCQNNRQWLQHVVSPQLQEQVKITTYLLIKTIIHWSQWEYTRMTGALLSLHTYLELDRDLAGNNKTHLEHDWERLKGCAPHCVATDCEQGLISNSTAQ